MSKGIRIPIQYIEVTRDKCSQTFGEGACEATGTKCYNTISTCKFLPAYKKTTQTDIFISPKNADINVYRALGDAVYPLLENLSHKSATINPGGAESGSSALGTRASVNITLRDGTSDDRFQDPYFFERSSPNERGTFFSKYFARNTYLYGRKLSVVNAELESGSIVNEQRRQYIITSTAGPSAQGTASFVAQDALVLTNFDKAVWPKPTGAVIAIDIDEQAGTVSVIPSIDGDGIQGSDISDWPAAAYIRINDECMYYTSKSGLVLTVERGKLGSQIESHSKDSTIQLVGALENLEPQEIIYEILSGGTDIPPEMLDLAQWDEETSLKPWLIRRYTAYITEPTSVRDLLADAALQMGFFPYPDEDTNLIKIKGTTSQKDYIDTAKTLNDTSHFLADSVNVQRDESNVITRVNALIGVRNWAADLKEADNYKARRIIATPEESEDRRGFVRNVQLPAYFLTAEQAELTARQILQQFMKANINFSFTLDISDTVKLADFVEVDYWRMTDEHGTPLTLPAQVTSVKEDSFKGTRQVSARYYPYSAVEDTDGVYNLLIPVNMTNINLADYFAQERPAVELKSGDIITFTMGAGVAIGSTDISTVAVDTGEFLEGVEVVISSPSVAYWVGKQGQGGKGAGVGAFPLPEDGGDGGDALIVRHPIKITGKLVVGGGGGGGGGGASIIGGDLNPTTRASGGGGGSGAGYELNSAGAAGGITGAGDYDDYLGGSGSQGTVSEGGSGGYSNGAGAYFSGEGGSGGNLGQNGSDGAESTEAVGGAGKGGAAGKAVVSGFSLITVEGGEVQFLGATE